MTDYTKLVAALRCNSLLKQCDSCKYGYRLCPDSECNDACHVERIIDDAADAIEALQAEVNEAMRHNTDLLNMKEMTKEEEDEILEYIRTIPVGPLEPMLIEQLPKRGEWINSKERMRPDMCSVCGCVYEADRFMDKIAWNYCPNCGAKMEVQDGK